MIQMVVLVGSVALGRVDGSPPSNAQLFWGQFSLLLVSDSIWGHCDMSVTVDGRGLGSVANACSSYNGPIGREAKRLLPAEVSNLRVLLRDADLFGKVAPGTDHRGIDLSLITLQARTEGREVEVVCYMNEDFEREGARKRLLSRLMELFNETHPWRKRGAHVRPNKAFKLTSGAIRARTPLAA
jgi:hypothetical protein